MKLIFKEDIENKILKFEKIIYEISIFIDELIELINKNINIGYININDFKNNYKNIDVINKFLIDLCVNEGDSIENIEIKKIFSELITIDRLFDKYILNIDLGYSGLFLIKDKIIDVYKCIFNHTGNSILKDAINEYNNKGDLIIYDNPIVFYLKDSNKNIPEYYGNNIIVDLSGDNLFTVNLTRDDLNDEFINTLINKSKKIINIETLNIKWNNELGKIYKKILEEQLTFKNFGNIFKGILGNGINKTEIEEDNELKEKFLNSINIDEFIIYNTKILNLSIEQTFEKFYNELNKYIKITNDDIFLYYLINIKKDTLIMTLTSGKYKGNFLNKDENILKEYLIKYKNVDINIPNYIKKDVNLNKVIKNIKSKIKNNL